MRFGCFLLAALIGPAVAQPASFEAGRLAQGEGEWLAGDLHSHSRHSEDSSNHPIRAMQEFATRHGLDFLLISDHDNHVGGATAQQTWVDPEFASDEIVMLYGAELTAERGHINTMSCAPYDHQRLYDLRDALDIQMQAAARDMGVQLSANHPAGKDAFSFSYDMVASVEVWNSAFFEDKQATLMLWDDLLKSGRMVTGIGGSDSHHGIRANGDRSTPRALEALTTNLGTPTTWVLAQARDCASVLRAIDRGRVSISANPYAPRVELAADTDGDGAIDMLMGDNRAATGQEISFTVRLAGGDLADAAYSIAIVKNGHPFRTLELVGARSLTFADTTEPGKRSYYRVEVLGPVPDHPSVPYQKSVAGQTVALSNPLFFNFDGG